MFLLKQPDHIPFLPPTLTIKLHRFATVLLRTLALLWLPILLFFPLLSAHDVLDFLMRTTHFTSYLLSPP